jgi:hypothetical protein
MFGRSLVRIIGVPITAGVMLACGVASAAQDQQAGLLTDAEAQAGWHLLFDGASLDGWRGFRQDDPAPGWTVVDGALTRVGGGGDIMTTAQFADFELSLEWQISEGGNSGIFFRVTEEADRTYESGPEMQVLDDARHGDGQSRLTSAGANFGLHAAPAGVVRPAGEWNVVRLLVQGPHVEHWLNGTKVVEYELWSPEWEALVAETKFADWPMYGRATRGHIALQDHGDWVAFRNIKIRALGEPSEPEGPMNGLTDTEVDAGWRLLFDGVTTDGWRGYQREAVSDGWQVVDGTLARVARDRDIITVEQFADFELQLEWRVGSGGNAGIMFRVTEDEVQPYWTGPEMQVLDDDGHADGRSPLTSAGADYALHAVPSGVARPAGEWNAVRLLVDGAHVEYWLNGVKVVEYELWSPEWEALVAASKFGEWPLFGRARRGHIALQDHAPMVSVAFRNIKIREIDRTD